jgi:hypothetical protein
LKISSRKAEKKARQAVRSADAEYETLKKRGSFEGISSIEREYTMKMAMGALNEANKVRRINHYPAYGQTEEEYKAERRDWNKDRQ